MESGQVLEVVGVWGCGGVRGARGWKMLSNEMLKFSSMFAYAIVCRRIA